MALTFTDATFASEVEGSDVPTLVDFWAPWCGPCKILGPVIEKIAEDVNGKGVKVGKLNVDENQAMAQKYGVMSIPTLLFFKNGKVVEQLVGVQPEEVIRQKLEALKA